MNMTEYAAVIPIVIVTLAGIAAMLAAAISAPGERMPIAGFGHIGLVGAALASVFLWDRDAQAFGVIRADNFTLFINLILCVVGVLTMLLSSGVVERENLPAGEYYALTLFAICGMMMMAAATDLLVIFIALEIFSLAVYVLTGIRRSSATSAEAAFKYFLLGSFSSAFFLYGVAFTYAVAGSTRLEQIGTALSTQAAGAPPTLALLAVGLLAVGFAFKVSAVPFHMWTPDAYEGAPTIVTAFMSTGVKAAAFAAFARVFLSPLEPLQGQWIPALSVIAAATMIVGTVVGVVQSNIKRMLAYSSIAHAGYLLLGIIAANSTGKSAILFYLLAYAVTNLGALGIVAILGTPQNEHDELRDFAGLWRSRPALAGLMTIFLLSLGGFPPTAGFIGKWYIFTAAVQEGHYWLAIIGVLTGVVSVFFYLRIVVMMYMSESAPEIDSMRPRVTAPAVAGLVLATAAVLYLGVLPTRVLDLAMDSIATIF
jgi:NADH-quinone oxidoreductase subunit N